MPRDSSSPAARTSLFAWSRLLFLGAAALLAPAALIAEDDPSTKAYTYVGIDGHEHEMLAHFPVDHQPVDQRPCYVFFHGGGWKSGDLKQGKPFCEYLASRGIVTVTANYSMHGKSRRNEEKLAAPQKVERGPALASGESRKRICVVDARTVIRWVKKNAADLGVDPNRLIVSGASAGAHISVLQMMDEQFDNPADPGDIDTRVQAFVLLAAAFTMPDDDPAPEVNVFQHVDKPFPPTLFIVGETDRWATAAQALARQLAGKAGNEIEFWIAPGMGHMFFRTGEAWYTTTKRRIDQFLTDHGFLTGEPRLPSPGQKAELRRVQF